MGVEYPPQMTSASVQVDDIRPWYEEHKHGAPAGKTCRKCGRTFPPTADHFHRNKTKADGLASNCKECQRLALKSPTSRDATANWKAAHPERVGHYTNKRRASAVPPADADVEMIADVYRFCDFLNERTDMEWHVDHTTPLSLGGTHHQDNLQVVPREWNLRKGNSHTNPWEGTYPELASEFI